MTNQTLPFWQPTWQQDAVEIKENNLKYKGFYKLSQMQLRYRCFSGEWSPWLHLEQVRSRDAAAVLLWDRKQDKLVLIEQVRMGIVASQREMSPWLLEIVAGLQEENELPEETARRETKEEAGYEIKELIPIGAFYSTPGGFTEKCTLFCGVVDATNNQVVYGQKQDEHEDIRVHVLPCGPVLDALTKGLFITSASTMIALQWFQLNYKKI